MDEANGTAVAKQATGGTSAGWINDQLSRLAAEEAIEGEFGKLLTLFPANKDDAHQLVQEESGATHGYSELGSGDPLYWHLLPIV
jgi:hypothetical protein